MKLKAELKLIGDYVELVQDKASYLLLSQPNMPPGVKQKLDYIICTQKMNKVLMKEILYMVDD